MGVVTDEGLGLAVNLAVAWGKAVADAVGEGEGLAVGPAVCEGVGPAVGEGSDTGSGVGAAAWLTGTVAVVWTATISAAPRWQPRSSRRTSRIRTTAAAQETAMIPFRAGFLWEEPLTSVASPAFSGKAELRFPLKKS